MGVAIRRAGADDRESVVRLLDETFLNDPVSSWIFPEKERREGHHRFLMESFLDAANSGGWVDVAEDGSAAALWVRVPADTSESLEPQEPQESSEPPGGAESEDGAPLVPGVNGQEAERIGRVNALTGEVHPHDGGAHLYLLLIAVSPSRQGEGLGTALINSVLDSCDRDGVPAYLEASSARSRELYLRLGFADAGWVVELPEGPRMWPLWRDPVTGAA
ncbi:GNAT family N-acetyltransferase [Streptomyces tsukubensis]|uniref:GNAT family N-acetyltransferase n=1 Tax=Streptomyces tsukubensis TaxID=83656 RepID=A0A1V4ABG9_9ACTN|nr:GNAT family N-acetyltransferase [Streptomyces tsukubensis]OON81216.1 GNAT family N-acetyltransferase [Streptomyces tsukubensis]QFR95671.1 GNAT family N-acetyltransferase [Streptomyces tsukubensis]